MTPIQHAGLMLQAEGQVVQIDPAQGSYDSFPAADLILITDIHGGHLSAPTLDKLRKASTVIVAPEAVAKSVTGATIVRNGETKTTYGGLRMYVAGDTENIPEMRAQKH